MNNDNFTVLSKGDRGCSVSLCTYYVAVAFKMTETLEQKICIKFCIQFALAGVAQWTECQPACEPEGFWFDSQPGHMAGLQARSLVGGHVRGNQSMDLSHNNVSLSLSPFSLKINK